MRGSTTRDTGFLVTEQGETIVLVKDLRQREWSRLTDAVTIEKTTYDGKTYQVVPNAGQTITDGVIEKVEPQWYW